MKISISSSLENVISFANLLEYKDSKSFLSVLILLIRGILYPGANLFSTAGGKEQAAQILQEKVKDICNKIPAFEKEIDWSRGKTKVGKDYCCYILKSGSTIENLAAKESTRGRRMHAKKTFMRLGHSRKIYLILFSYKNEGIRLKEVLNRGRIYLPYNK